jgi:receptor protein-tyrosine kinase
MMSSIDRLFSGDRAVPGLRTGSSRVHQFVPANDSVDVTDAVETSARGDDVVQNIESYRQANHAEAEILDRAGHAAGADDTLQARREAADDAEVVHTRQVRTEGGTSSDLMVVEPILLRPDPLLLIAHDQLHPHSENVRMLRTELLLRHADQATANAIAILSACSGEGRSQLAAELAISLAQLQRPTLLIDADFRNPRQHTLFGTELRGGLAHALRNGERPQVERVAGLPNLALMNAGARPDNAVELLTSSWFEQLMEALREDYDFIVVDTPPVAEYADATAVATVVGRVLTVCRARKTPYAMAREMMRRLSATDAHVLGGVLNHF